MSGSGSGGDAALAQQHEAQQQQQQPQQQQQLEQPHELSDTDSSEWALPKNVAGGAGAGAAGGSATGTAQQQQTQQVGTIGQQQQPGSGDEANQIYSSATVYAVRSFWGSSVVLVVVWHVRLALWLPRRSTGDVFSPHESVPTAAISSPSTAPAWSCRCLVGSEPCYCGSQPGHGLPLLGAL